jgi:hypothetical protein
MVILSGIVDGRDELACANCGLAGDGSAWKMRMMRHYCEGFQREGRAVLCVGALLCLIPRQGDEKAQVLATQDL